MTDQLRAYRTGIPNIGPGFKPGFYPDPIWEDANFDVLAITVPGNNSAPVAYVIPTTGLVLPNFPNGAAVTEVAGSKELDHAWKLGSSIFPHAHVRKIDAGAGDIFLGFEYQVIYGTTKVTGEKTLTLTVTNVAQLDEVLFADLGEIDLSTIVHVGAQITFRFYRDPTNEADDFAGDIAVTTFGWHYLRDSDGSRYITGK